MADPVPPPPPPVPDTIYEFVIKTDLKVDGVPLSSVNASFKTTGIVKETATVIHGAALAVKFPKLDAPPRFVLLSPLPFTLDGSTVGLTYAFAADAAPAARTPLNGPQLFFWGSEALLAATGKEAITFWATADVTVQIIVGYDAKPKPA